MPSCPRCNRAVPPEAIACPHCNLTLKAHGHPGMTLFQAKDGTALCPTCAYDADDSCTFSKRPNAQSCTLYTDINAVVEPKGKAVYQIPWWRKYRVKGVLIAIAVVLVLVLLSTLS